nr:hypothetical protein [Tanacetum cinerariifolium]
MDLFGPTFVKSLNKKSHYLVVTDDYSRFTWVFFLATNDETSPILKTFITGLENQLSLKVKAIRSDNGTEFKNSDLNQFCGMKGIKKEFSNRVLVTKPHNKTPYELLHGRTPSIGFMRPFGCPVNILNTLDSLGKFERKETLHANFLENKPNVPGSGPTWLFDIDSLTKTMNYQPINARNQTNPSAGFQEKIDAEKAREEIDQQYVLFPMWSSSFTNPQNIDEDASFDGKEHDFDVKKPEYEVILSPSSRYRDLNAEFEDCSDNNSNEVNAVGSIVHTIGQNPLNNTNTFSATGPSNAAVNPTYGKSSFIDASQLFDDPDMPELEDITYSDDENAVVIGDLSSTTQTRSMTRVVKDQGGLSQMFNDDFHTCMFACFLSQEEPKRVHQALKDPSWIEAMQEDLLQFKMQKVWVLVDLPHGKRAIVARIEAIRLFLAYASLMGFMVYQMDVKSAFLYRTIDEEVYVCQPLGFKDPDHPDKVYKVVKALYGLHQAPRACQDKYVAEILRKLGLTEGKSASTPIDTEKPLLKDPDGEDVDVHTYRSMIGSLMYLTLSRPDIMFAVCVCACFQVTPKASHLHAVKRIFRSMISSLMYLTLSRPDIMFAVCVCVCFQVTPKASHLHAVKRIFRYLKGKTHLGLWYPKDSPFDLVAYSDSDYAGASLDRKSRTRGCQFLGYRLIYWQCKKQTVVATSSTEAEYVAAASCYAQVLWIQNQLLDYGQQIGDFSTHTTKYTSPALTQKVFANMRIVEHVEADTAAQGDDTTTHGDDAQEPSIPSPTPPRPPPQPPRDVPSTSQRVDTSEDTVMDDASNQGRIIDEIDKDDVVALMDDKEKDKKEEEAKEDEPAEVQKVVDVVTTAKLITEVVTAASEIVTAASTIISAAEPQVTAATITAAHVRVATASTRRRKGVVIRDPEEESTTSSIIPADTKSKDKRKGIMVEEPKPLMKKQQVKIDEEYASY